jgi:16S rRNA (guanine(966)-N(2))-methyltransferase RsmD
MSRIISGQFGGLYIANPKHDIRPTTGKVKEFIFNVLQNLEGRSVLDLFCGTGALGIEALSRYADHVTFVDKHPKSLHLTRENLISIKADPDQWVCIRENAFKFIEQNDTKFDIILADPPYDLVLNQHFFAACREHLKDHGTLILEYTSRIKLDLADWEPSKIKKMGDTNVYFLNV